FRHKSHYLTPPPSQPGGSLSTGTVVTHVCVPIYLDTVTNVGLLANDSPDEFSNHLSPRPEPEDPSPGKMAIKLHRGFPPVEVSCISSKRSDPGSLHFG